MFVYSHLLTDLSEIWLKCSQKLMPYKSVSFIFFSFWSSLKVITVCQRIPQAFKCQTLEWYKKKTKWSLRNLNQFLEEHCSYDSSGWQTNLIAVKASNIALLWKISQPFIFFSENVNSFINPLTPRAFCQKCIFWTFWR